MPANLVILSTFNVFAKMSSHHVVKEDQEPALIMADAGAVPVTVVEQLLEWSPTVIVLEAALEPVMDSGIKFDVLVSTLNNVKAHVVNLAGYAPLKILSHQPGDRPLDTALMFLLASKYRSVNVVGVAPDAFISPVTDLDIVTFYNGLRWSFVRSGRFEKWLKKGIELRFISQHNLIKQGLVDNVVQDEGLVTIAGNTSFWVGEPYA
jgi:thiamine pyrophosphokinase